MAGPAPTPFLGGCHPPGCRRGVGRPTTDLTWGEGTPRMDAPAARADGARGGDGWGRRGGGRTFRRAGQGAVHLGRSPLRPSQGAAAPTAGPRDPDDLQRAATTHCSVGRADRSPGAWPLGRAGARDRWDPAPTAGRRRHPGRRALPRTVAQGGHGQLGQGSGGPTWRRSHVCPGPLASPSLHTRCLLYLRYKNKNH